MRVPDHTVVYAIGDIHGCPWLLDKVLSWIEFHAADHIHARKLIIVLGDMIDRGPDSRTVIDTLLEVKLGKFELICLRGNHEDMMLCAIQSGAGVPLWMDNGARYTLESYGIDSIEFLKLVSPKDIRETLRAAVPPSHQRFLQETRLCHREGDYLFVHAGLRPGVAIEHQTPDDMMWIRQDFTDSTAGFGVLVVHGHTVTHSPSERGNAIGLDTGAVITGRLSCLALWNDQRFIFFTPGIDA